MINLDEHIFSINQEIKLLFNYKKNLKKFVFSQTVSGKLIMMDFERIINEIHRITLEIIYLEQIKTQLTKINNNE